MRRPRRMFSSLGKRNFRIYFTGQMVSVTGTWMQHVGQAWLVLELTGSGTLLGVTSALQMLPLLLAGSWGGLVADRVDKRRLLLCTQTAAGTCALTLGVLTATGVVRLWMVMALALALGTVNMLDHPTRQSFVLEIVGGERIANAVALNSTMINVARVIGPGAAGLLIAGVGIAPTFLLNAASYFAALVTLALMRPGELLRAPGARRRAGQIREGWRYVRRTPELAGPLALMAAVGMIAYEFQVVLPLLARYTFGGDAQTYGGMNSAMGVGAVIGGLAVASLLKPSPRTLVAASLALGAAITLVALSPSLPVALALLLVTGAASITFIATTNALLQLRAAPEMRGRVMALWGIAFLGTTPIGGPVVGWVAEVAGPRVALGLGGGTAVAGAVALAVYLRRRGVLVGEPVAPGTGDAPAPVPGAAPPR